MPSLPTLLLSALPLLSFTLATPFHPHPRQTPVRTGKITLFLPSPPGSTTPGQPIGCLDTSGRLTITSSDCATYTHTVTNNLGLVRTEAGPCGFHDPTEPDNPDQAGDFRAWRCKAGLVRPNGEAPDILIISDNKPYNNLITVSGSGVNYGVFSKEVPVAGKPVDVFTRAFDLGVGSVDMVWLWEGN